MNKIGLINYEKQLYLVYKDNNDEIKVRNSIMINNKIYYNEDSSLYAYQIERILNNREYKDKISDACDMELLIDGVKDENLDTSKMVVRCTYEEFNDVISNMVKEKCNMITYDFENKNVIVTGASMGLGKAIALEFAKAKANVIIADINEEEALKTKEELDIYGGKILTFKLDVSNYDENLELADFAVKNLGSIDILVNNAGIFVAEPFNIMEVEKMNKMISVNTNGTVYGCKAILPIMKEQGYGKVVNMSSIAAKLGGAGAAVYSSTKAFVLELTACLAREYAKDGININCILPGIIRTPLWEHALDEMTQGDASKKDEVFGMFTKDIPMGRPQEPVDIAKAVLFLCTSEADNITAQNLAVDGGHTY